MKGESVVYVHCKHLYYPIVSLGSSGMLKCPVQIEREESITTDGGFVQATHPVWLLVQDVGVWTGVRSDWS